MNPSILSPTVPSRRNSTLVSMILIPLVYLLAVILVGCSIPGVEPKRDLERVYGLNEIMGSYAYSQQVDDTGNQIIRNSLGEWPLTDKGYVLEFNNGEKCFIQPSVGGIPPEINGMSDRRGTENIIEDLTPSMQQLEHLSPAYVKIVDSDHKFTGYSVEFKLIKVINGVGEEVLVLIRHAVEAGHMFMVTFSCGEPGTETFEKLVKLNLRGEAGIELIER